MTYTLCDACKKDCTGFVYRVLIPTLSGPMSEPANRDTGNLPRRVPRDAVTGYHIELDMCWDCYDRYVTAGLAALQGGQS